MRFDLDLQQGEATTYDSLLVVDSGFVKNLLLLVNSLSTRIFALHHEKTCFGICENKGADQLRGDRAADPRLCFRFIIRLLVHCIYFLNPKFQGSSHLLGLYSPVCADLV